MEDKATQEWLDSLKKSTRHTYQYHWQTFLEFVGSTGDQILESRKADENYTWEKRIMEFRDWLINERKMSEHTAKTAGGVVRGFFNYHGRTHKRPLEFRRSEGARLGEAKTKTEDYRFSLEDLKKMFDVADLEEKYILTTGKSFGLRAGDFLRLTRGDLEPYLDRPVPISIGKYSTQKESAPAYPFIDADALPVIKLMIDKMTRDGRGKPNDRILTFSHEIELTRAIRRLVSRAGIMIGNKRVRFHCMRKFLIDRLSSFMSESKWKQIVGKTISEGAYVSPDSLRNDYMRAMAETTFKREEDEKQRAIEQIRMMEIAKTISEEKAKKMIEIIKMRRASSIEEIMKTIKEETEKTEAEDPNDCLNGQHCGEFKEIGESELLAHLNQGWQIVHNLQNGRVIIKRRGN